MLGDLEFDIPNLRLVNASIDIGDNYIEVDYSNAGSGGNFSPSSFLRINLTVEPTVVPIAYSHPS